MVLHHTKTTKASYSFRSHVKAGRDSAYLACAMHLMALPSRLAASEGLCKVGIEVKSSMRENGKDGD